MGVFNIEVVVASKSSITVKLSTEEEGYESICVNFEVYQLREFRQDVVHMGRFRLVRVSRDGEKYLAKSAVTIPAINTLKNFYRGTYEVRVDLTLFGLGIERKKFIIY